jgi:hypothetical protein
MALNWGQAGQGAVAGAAAGAPFGGIGAGVGAGIGALGGFLGGGNKDKIKKLPALTSQQQQLLANLQSQLQGGQVGQNYGQAQNYFGDILGGTSQDYDRFAAPYLNRFNEQILPGIAERFAGLGGGLGGAMNSSGFAQALGGAGAGLQADLANLYANIRQNAAQAATGQYNTLTGTALNTPEFLYSHRPGTPGFGTQALSGVAQGYGQGLGQASGNWFGRNLPQPGQGQQGGTAGAASNAAPGIWERISGMFGRAP